MAPRVSVFTPTHDPKFLSQCLVSLRAQTFKDFEWVIGLNNGAKLPKSFRLPKWAHAEDLGTCSGVGVAKKLTLAFAEGEIFVELDHDDRLLPEALQRIVEAFDATPAASLVYSNAAQINENGSPNYDRFDPRHGWEYREHPNFLECIAPEPTPHNVSCIWYAPNHVRAFRRVAYESAGGFSRREILDDQELMAKLYQRGPFVHLDECLYLQRVHAGNTQRDPIKNARIQVETWQLYDETIEANALAWSARQGLKALDLGAAHNAAPGYTPVDRALDGKDIFTVLRATKTGSVGIVRAFDFVEHVGDSVRLLNELYRVLAHGGILVTHTPSTDGRGAYQDPTHVSFWNSNRWWYFTNEWDAAKYVPEITCRFQRALIYDHCPTPWHSEHEIRYTKAILVAGKDGPRQGGLDHWATLAD